MGTNRPTVSSMSTSIQQRNDCEKTVFCMVGLPARGKTYISRKLTRYLKWVGLNTKVFNVGIYRRRLCPTSTSEFFRPDNEKALATRKQATEEALADMVNYLLNGDGVMAVFDGSNATRESRTWVYDQCTSKGLQVVFIESICDNPAIVEQNIREVKLSCPDYVDMNKDDAVKDFLERIRYCESNFETMCEKLDSHLSFIKNFNQGEKFIMNRIRGSLLTRIACYLMNIRVTSHTIYISRHGESEFNLSGRIGGDSSLSERGVEYARQLAKYLKNLNVPDLKVWTSNFKRTKQTVQFLTPDQYTKMEQWMALNEIDAGVCEGMTYEEIQEQYPEEFAKRDEDKFSYRYPQGESYADMVARLEPVILELEHGNNVLVICHQAVARCLVAYFTEEQKENLPYVNVPLHTVIKLTPTTYSCLQEFNKLNVDAVNTHRSKPQVIDKNRSAGEALSTVPDHK